MLSSVLTYLRFAILSLSSVFGILILILVLINAKDTNKNTNTLALEQWMTQIAIPDADNGFIFGLQLASALSTSNPMSLTPEHNGVLNLYEAACHEGTLIDCLACYRQNAFNASRLLEENQTLILQYQQLLDKKNWQESLNYSGERPQINFNNLRIIRRLAQLNALVNSTANNPNTIIEFLDKEYRFWHKVQGSTYYLDTYMHASQWLEDNLEWGANMLEAEDPIHGTFPKAWLLTNKIPSPVVQRIIAGEYQIKKHMLLEMVSNSDPELTKLDIYINEVLSYFVSVDDTLNILSEQLMTDYLRFEQGEIHIAIIEQKNPAIYCTDGTSLSGLWARKYNPFGKMLTCLPTIDIGKYLFEAQERITLLQNQARKQRYQAKITFQ
jgi:hypothetical protein